MSGISTQQEQQVRELITSGNKISAIKLYRETMGIGLKEAKDAVDAIERGESFDIPTPAQICGPTSGLENQISRLLAEQKKIEAVKVYREAYNCGLKDAKDAVDAIEAKMRREASASLPSAPGISNDPFAEDTQRNRRFLVIIFAIVLIVIAGAVLFFLAGRGF